MELVVNVEVIFHRQILNSSWEASMSVGLSIAVVGIILIVLGIRKSMV